MRVHKGEYDVVEGVADLADPGFWEAGLDLVERQCEQAEAAAEATGRV